MGFSLFGHTELDYAVALNNNLQGHPTGNLTKFFQYVMTREGRDDARIHIATAKFHGLEYAIGRGRNKAEAKRDAAKQVYEDFLNGVPEAVDYADRLNLLLQEHPTGDLTAFLHYASVMSKEVRDNAPIHIAVKFRGIEAVGCDRIEGAAKRDAAKKVYEHFLRNGVPAHEEPELLTLVISIG